VGKHPGSTLHYSVSGERVETIGGTNGSDLNDAAALHVRFGGTPALSSEYGRTTCSYLQFGRRLFFKPIFAVIVQIHALFGLKGSYILRLVDTPVSQYCLV
jgi:hypothetical protein